MKSNKSSSFSSYYYTITDLTEATRIALVYSVQTLQLSDLVNYDINDRELFTDCLIIDKVEGSFSKELESSDFKFNYILVLGLNDMIKAMVSISDVIDVSSWNTEMITIEFDYNIVQKNLQGDSGTLVSVHISDGVRKTVHKDLINKHQVINKSGINSLNPVRKPFIRDLIKINEGDVTHYSGNVLINENNSWSQVNKNEIQLGSDPTSEGIPVKILMDGTRVSYRNHSLYFNNVEVTGFDDNSIVANNYLVKEETRLDENNQPYQVNALYRITNGVSTEFIKDASLNYKFLVNSVNQDLVFYGDKDSYSRNFKLFELIKERKSDGHIDQEVNSIWYFTDILYIRSDRKLISYLHENACEISEFDLIMFISDTVFITEYQNAYTLYEDTVDGLKKYNLGNRRLLHNLYMISKSRTSIDIDSSRLVTYKGLVYYYDEVSHKLISI